jgi:hypothetical protein
VDGANLLQFLRIDWNYPSGGGIIPALNWNVKWRCVMEKPITTKKPAAVSKSGKTAVVTEKKATVPPPKEVKASCTQATQTPSRAAEPRITIINDEPKASSSSKIDAQKIAQRAYYLWEKEGYQHGRDREYWLRAEELLKKDHSK